MEESTWRSPNEGRLRARVEARRRRERQLNHLLSELDQLTHPGKTGEVQRPAAVRTEPGSASRAAYHPAPGTAYPIPQTAAARYAPSRAEGAETPAYGYDRPPVNLHMASRRSHALDLPFFASPSGARHSQATGSYGSRSYGPRSDSSLRGILRGLATHAYTAAAGLMALMLFATLFLSRCGGAGKQRVQAAALPTRTVTAEQNLLAQVIAPRQPVTILVLGSDKRASDASFRTDVVMLVTVDGQKRQVSALSFPRDLIVNIPNYGDDRINTVMEHGGFELMQDTFETNYGVRPQYYFLTNFSNFVTMINSIGGVDVQVSQPLEDACDLNWSRGGTCAVDPGVKAMDGDTALWYIRSRHTSSDFDRLRRAQEVMVAIFNRFMQMNAILRLPELYQQYSQQVETNMQAADLLRLMPTAAMAVSDPQRVKRYTIPAEYTGDYITYAGARVLLPNKEAIRQLVKEASFGE